MSYTNEAEGDVYGNTLDNLRAIDRGDLLIGLCCTLDEMDKEGEPPEMKIALMAWYFHEAVQGNI